MEDRTANRTPGGPVKIRWYGGSAGYKGPKVPIQTEDRRFQEMPRPVVQEAFDQYVRHGHRSQTFDRLNERGGFGIGELVMLLADAASYWKEEAMRLGWMP